MHFPKIERQLTPHERAVTTWMLSNGDIPERKRRKFLAQLENAVVIRQCTCGCASIDFGVEGLPEPKGAFRILGDYVTADDKYGMFVFAKEGILAGIDVYEMAADAPASVLPNPSVLRPFHPASDLSRDHG